MSSFLLLGVGKDAAAGGGGSAVTWNPTGLSANLSLSGGNLIVTALNATGGSVLSTAVARSTGLVYLEFIDNADSSPSDLFEYAFGLCAVGGSGPFDATSGMCMTAGGQFWLQNAHVAASDVPSALTTSAFPNAAMCVDLVNNTAWWRGDNLVNGWNGNASANPATNTGGISFAAIAGNKPLLPCIWMRTSPAQTTTNFGATAYHFTAPAGSINWT